MSNDLIVWRKWYLPRMFKTVKPHRRTVCHVLIELAKIHQNDPVSMAKIQEAYDMVRRMQNKLHQYNENEKLSSLHDTDGVTGEGPLSTTSRIPTDD